MKLFFNELKLEITLDCNYKIDKFWNLNLNNNTYEPYHKLNQILFYIDYKSNMKKAIISNISKRISISQNENISDKNKDYYNEALIQSGYQGKIKY